MNENNPAQNEQTSLVGPEEYAPPAHQHPFTLRDMEDGDGFPIGRVFSALRRYWWVLVLSLLGGLGVAFGIFKVVAPEYRAEGAIWVMAENRGDQVTGPISQGGLLESTGWIELMTSYSVLEPVVLAERLYLGHSPSDSLAFQDFTLGRRFQPGDYTLSVASDGLSYTLIVDNDIVLEEGDLGGAIGVQQGFRWSPRAETLTRGEAVSFSVVTPRDAARSLAENLSPTIDRQGNFIRLRLEGKDPEKITRVLNAVMEKHVEVAAEIKREKLDALTSILEEQLQTVEADLRLAESDLVSYQVQTVTLPSEETSPIVPGLQQTRGPAFGEYYQLRVDQDAVQRDRIRLEAALAASEAGNVPVESFEMIPTVQTSSQLMTALSLLTQNRAELRVLEDRYTREYGPVVDLMSRMATLETVTIPALGNNLVEELRAREDEIGRTLDARGEELAEIPPRAIEETRRQRTFDIRNRFYLDLRQRFETAQLAAASSIPDVSILDVAQVPRRTASDPRIHYGLVSLLAALAFGAVLILFLERFDNKLRDPADIGGDIGLDWLGAIPRYRRGSVGGDNSEEIREAFRDLRMKLDFAIGAARPLLISITSPSEGEGKTFVSANLANAFADLGRKTILVDGDTRRGDLHHVLDRNRKPGLTDFLMNGQNHKVIQETDNPRLHFVGFGSRTTSSPELLNSANMQNFLAGLKRRYEVIIFDSPPMAAGSDAFVLGAHAGNSLMVLRSGTTDKELAAAKMDSFLRLPVRVLGAVLNDFRPQLGQGYYRYYSHYLPGYEATAEPEEVGAGV